MEDNKRDFGEFFNNGEKAEDNGRKSREDDKQEQPSYYYSYGPYKSAVPDESEKDNADLSSREVSPVEVSAPHPVKPIPFGQDSRTPFAAGAWSPGQVEKRRSSARSLFAAFMAGAVLVGSLMFASDRMNWFSGGHEAAAGGGAASIHNGSAPASSGVTGASLDVARPGSISQIVQQASPAVVKIDTYVTAKQRTRSNSLQNDPFFRYFFGDGSQDNQQQPKADTKQQAGMGTGFIFEKSGYILTNQHVVDGADSIEVTVQGYDKPFKAQLLGNSFDLDLAVLKIEGDKEFPILPIGDSNNTNIGDWVVAIGNPYGFDHTVTVGVLSAREREISIPEQQGTRNYKHLFQTDASINPGNSGGPLLNLNGEVVGINTAVNAQAQGIGFAIPTSTITEVLDKLKNNVKIPLPFIGASLTSLKDVDAETLKELNISTQDGCLVGDVLLGTPAFKAGLKKYDAITTIDGAAVKTNDDLIKKIQAKKPGDKATFGIIRDGKESSIDITVGDRNEYNQKQQQQQQ